MSEPGATPNGEAEDLEEILAHLDAVDFEGDSPEAGGEIESPVVRLVNEILKEADRRQAEEVHIEPLAKHVRLRYRVDGVLSVEDTLPNKLSRGIAARLKIIAMLDIAERRLPQAGSMTFMHNGNKATFLVETLPTPHGEKMFLRRLDREAGRPTLDDLNFTPALREAYSKLLQRPRGLILHVGPTNGGRERALRASLEVLNRPDRNVMTVEDPILLELPGVIQMEVRNHGGFGMPMRSAMRQQPEVLMVSELRDREAAETALDAALRGSLVLAGLSVQDPLAAVQRLGDLGLEPFLVADGLLGICAHHQARSICLECAEERDADPQEREMLGGSCRIKVARGCGRCQNGYRGRIGLHALLRITPAVGEKIRAGAPRLELAGAAREAGMHTLREDALAKVKAGLTTLSEALRVTAD